MPRSRLSRSIIDSFVILKFLWWIEYATKNSKVIATGRTSSGLTGLTDDLATPSGQDATSKAMRYRFIEDFIQSVFLEGGWYTGYSKSVYATSDPSGFSYNTYKYMNKLAYTSPASYSYPCVMSYGWDDTYPFLCLPNGGTSNSNREEGYCSSYGIGNYCVKRGRDIGAGNYVYLDTVASISSSTACYTRLVYLGELNNKS